ncbi:MAG: hypothetical protein ABGW77_05615 [Campylobacterales bacterium]
MKRLLLLISIFGVVFGNQIFPMDYKTTVQFKGKSSLYWLGNPPVEVVVYDQTDSSPLVRIGKKVIEGLQFLGLSYNNQKTKVYSKKLANGWQLVVQIESEGAKSVEELNPLLTQLCNHLAKRGQKEILIYINTSAKKGFFIQLDSCGGKKGGKSPTPGTPPVAENSTSPAKGDK